MQIEAGIVLYNPNIERLEDNIKSLVGKVNNIILVDNDSENIREIQELVAGRQKISLICNNSNLGIAKALNEIFNYSKGKNWILLMDQDSIWMSNFSKSYKEANSIHPNVRILCPQIVDRNGKEEKTTEGPDFEVVTGAINSGMLVHWELWNQIGGFDENLFIDSVDFDFVYRAKRKSKIIRCNNAVLLHELGENIVIHKFAGKIIKVSPHVPWRYYHMAYSKIYLFKKYHDWLWVRQWIKGLLKVVLFETQKKEKLSNYMGGTLDSIRE